MRFQVGGSVAAARMALDRGWAINIGGGFHHASSRAGGGFCAYADITLVATTLLKHDPRVHNIMIVDLDAHQVEHSQSKRLRFTSVHIQG